MPAQPVPSQRFPALATVAKMTVPFGGSTAQEAFHPGVDVAGPLGAPVPAPASGRVVGVDYGHQQGENNFGNSVIIEDADGNKHRYSHLKRGYVQVGDTVKEGQPIAEMGNSGAAYSPSGLGDGTNLDYRIVNAYGNFVDPTPYIQKYM